MTGLHVILLLVPIALVSVLHYRRRARLSAQERTAEDEDSKHDAHYW